MELESGSERFRVPKTPSQVKGLVNDAVPASTKYKNNWAVNIFAEWKFRFWIVVDFLRITIYTRQRQGHSRECRFCWNGRSVAQLLVFKIRDGQVAKKSDERYPPKSVYGIICALKRYLEEKNGSEA